MGQNFVAARQSLTIRSGGVDITNSLKSMQNG